MVYLIFPLPPPLHSQTQQFLKTEVFQDIVGHLELPPTTKVAMLEGKGLGTLEVRRAMAKLRTSTLIKILGLESCAGE